ncbi:hypothetical protein [Winogradskyella sp. A3E31]|uniref:hypothetical protein n=1 Tax=Winogradskyella sp. A3E31 TaxID=3349637 RepID=UPI00398A62BE
MIKRLVVIVITIFSCQSYAQQGTASPYSFYGIGSLKFKGTVENRAMGGISTYLDSLHINLRNPAAYAGKNLDQQPFNGESRPVKFAVAGTFTSLELESNQGSEQANTSTFDYIALTMPVGRKFGVGFGLLPFTSVGYKLESLNDDEELQNRYRGEGGLNKVFVGMGYQISDALSLGIDLNYNFGNVQNSAIAFSYDGDGNPTQYQTRQDNRSDLSGLNFNLGLAYKKKISEKLMLSATTTFSPESRLSSENQRSFSTIIYNDSTEEEFVQETQDADLESEGLKNTDLTLPSRFSLGFGVGQETKWFVGAEYVLQKTGDYDNPIFSTQNSSFEDSPSFAVGGFYIPDYNSFSNYFKRVVYRGGFNFGKSGLIINNESINEFGMSFGLGLPLGGGTGGGVSELNIGFEYGQRGTTNQNLIKENFINLNISLSLNDRWFAKRKYN